MAAQVAQALRTEVQPASPTYMAYVYQPGFPSGATSSTRPRPFQPASQSHPAEVAMKDGRGVYEHFHAPCNDYNKFLASVRDDDKYAYRDLPRMAPPPFDKSGRSSIRPASPAASGGAASRSRSASRSPRRQLDTSGMSLSDRTVTQTGAPCYNVSIRVPADLQQGCPVPDDEASRHKGVAYVQTYEVPPAAAGFGEGGRRPFHQDYRHYKYFGFAGKGAKTSWAHNPKMNEPTSWQRQSAKTSESRPVSAPPAAVHTAAQLTKAQAALVGEFKKHAYSAEKHPPPTILEPYVEIASLDTRQPLAPAQASGQRRHDKVHVLTHTQLAPGALTLVENPSPNMGSQAPFHQRYSHYRLHGFAGKGATSSWARNPKFGLLYDNL